MNKDWTDKLRESLKDCQISEPDGLWEGVQAGLVHGTGSKVRPMLWISVASAAAAAAIAALLYIGNGNRPRVEGRAVADSDFGVVENLPSSDDGQAVEELTAEAQVESFRTPKARPSDQDRVLQDFETESFVFDSEEIKIDDAEPVNGSSETVETGNSQVVVTKDFRSVDDAEAVRSYWDAVAGTMDLKPSGRKLSLIASVGGLTKGASESFGGYSGFQNSEPRMQFSSMSTSKANGFFAEMPDDIPLFSEASSVMLANLDNEDVRTESNHHQPIRYSLEVEYMLTKRLGIVTGLSYSRLMSEITSGSELSSYTVKQKLDYLGIPLALSWHVVDKNRFGLYAKFGGMGEKALSGSSVTAYDHGNGLHDGDARKLREGRLQWSLASSIGAGVTVWNGFSLFAEPGISYYFDNRSDVDNIYKERPFNFNMNIGIRANLSR